MYQRKRAPKVSLEQEKKQKKRLRSLSRAVFKASNDEVDVIMDDETYFNENGMNFYGMNTFSSSKPNLEPKEVRFNSRKKYPFKLLVWVAISKRGRTAWYIKPTNGAVNSDLYIKECLKKRLIPFIKKKYPDGNYVF